MSLIATLFRRQISISTLLDVVKYGHLAITSTNTKVVDTVNGVTNTFSFYGIVFHDNGVVSAGTLPAAKAVTVGGNSFSICGEQKYQFQR